MLYNAYTIYDCKSLTYSPPFFVVAHGQACRMVMDAALDPNTNLGRHPADFVLHCIGQFDDATGRMLPNDVREHVSDVLALVRVEPRLPFDIDPKDTSRGPLANGKE